MDVRNVAALLDMAEVLLDELACQRKFLTRAVERERDENSRRIMSEMADGLCQAECSVELVTNEVIKLVGKARDLRLARRSPDQ